MITIEKELPQISWLVDEPSYRADPALSYSTISTYESLGFDGLDHLFDRKETPSLLLGSCVDSIITGGMEEFNDRFAVIDATITDGGMDTLSRLKSMELPFKSFNEIPEQIVSDAAKEVGFWKADKWDKVRYKKVLETGNVAEYYDACMHSDKTLVTQKMYQDVLNCVRALKESPATASYFADNDMLSPIRRYYQLKFKAELDGVPYRCMADMIAVNYEKKIIYPCDLKTSSTEEWNFEKSFVKWHYLIQAMLYWKLIRYNLNKDPYFKDFKLHDYRFIVVNPRTLTPLVWEFPLTQAEVDLVDDDGNVWKHPLTLGKELYDYLMRRPRVPNGVSLTGVNTITCLHKA